METCENCHKAIGALETPHLWRQHVVCAKCHRELADGSTPAQLGAVDYQSRSAEFDPRRYDKPIVVKLTFGEIQMLAQSLCSSLY
jgi:hypothetical protein